MDRFASIFVGAVLVGVGCRSAPDKSGLPLGSAPQPPGSTVDTGDLDTGLLDPSCPQPTSCISLAEAWDRDLADIWYDGELQVENQGPYDICMDDWHLFFTQTSQDAAGGHAAIDYPGGGDAGLAIGPGERWSLAYTDREGPAWWCVERTQQTAYASDFHFNGAKVPDPLLEWIFYETDTNGNGTEDHVDFPELDVPASQAQLNVWDAIAEGPVFAVGRVPNYLELRPGESAELVIEVTNLGRGTGSMTVGETIPAGSSARDFSIEPSWSVENSDGSTTFWWSSKMAASEDDPDNTQPTAYAEMRISYTLTWDSPDCGERVTTWAPQVRWADVRGDFHTSTGTPLVIACCEG